MPPASHARMVRLLDVELVGDFASEADAAAQARRYAVLFADEGTARRGGLGRVCRVTNAYGESFALKTLLPAGDPALDHACELAFRQEFQSQRMLQGCDCVPRLHAWGSVDGSPAILMEWVEGATLERVRALLAADDAGRLSPPTVAALGRDLFDALSRLAAAAVPVVHRDVSPANVMVRTARRSLEQQVADGTFDLCLIDLGSSVAADADARSLTRAGVAVRWATPDYAPPEMLTDDVAGIEELRQSPAIDVFAAASVLFELACARLPFGEKGAMPASPYRLKAEGAPAPAVMAHANAATLDAVLSREPDVAAAVADALRGLPEPPSAEKVSHDLGRVDAQLARALASCLVADQSLRPSAAAVRDRLAAICAYYAANVGHALRGEPLEPCGRQAACTASLPAPYRAARVLSYACSLALTAAVCVALGMAGAGPACAAFALPLAAGLAVRGRVRNARSALVRGAVGVVTGAVVALLATTEVAAPVLPEALLATCALAWLPVAVDYATLPDAARPSAASAKE